MKKSLFFLLITLLFSIPVFSQEATSPVTKVSDEHKSTLTYSNLPVVKILEGKDAYVVLYQKNRTGIGTTVIPKKWAKPTKESPRKLTFRKPQHGVGSYMTIVKKDGSFLKVVLNVPLNKKDSVWGVADYHKDIEGSDKDTLEEIEL